MDLDSTAFFRDLRAKDPANNACIDCGNAKLSISQLFATGAPNPQWASITHGSFICLMCSGIHRGLGVQISFVRSLSMDTWNERQKSLMQSGGNTKLKALLEEYVILLCSTSIQCPPIRASPVCRSVPSILRKQPSITENVYASSSLRTIVYCAQLQALVDHAPAVTAPSKEEGRQAVTKTGETPTAVRICIRKRVQTR